MPDQIITTDDIKMIFGDQIAQLMLDSLALQKQLEERDLLLRNLTTNEAALVDRIQSLEIELVELKATHLLPPGLTALSAQADKSLDKAKTNE